MTISFQLTMPNVGSWNGKWSGQGRPYFVIKSISKKYFTGKEHLKELLDKKRDSWYYRWEDGWGASVIAEIVDAREAAKRRKASCGFCGYEWMIDSILWYGEISSTSDRRKEQEKLATA